MLQKTDKIFPFDNQRCCVYARMETDPLRLQKFPVDEHMHVMLLIIYQPKGRDRAGHHPQIFLQSLLGSKTELSLMQLVLYIMDVHVLVTVQQHKVVPVSFMVAEEEVLAMLGIMAGPILLGNLDCRGRRMLQIFEFDV